MTALKSKKILLLAVVATIAVLVTGGSTNAATIQYEYDALNRLIRVTYDANTSIEYTYDAAGNRTQRVVIAVSENGPYHPVDTDSDYVIGDFELLDYITLWKGGQVGDFELLDTISLWKAGHYYWDESEQKFKPGEKP